MSRQIPLMYALMVVNSCFLSFATWGAVPSWESYGVPVILSVGALTRSLLWLGRRRRPMPTTEAIERYLVGTLIAGIILSIAFGGWGLLLFDKADLIQRTCIAMYIFIGAIICSYCLQPLPTAGKMMLICGAMPITFRLLVTGDWFLTGLGLNLVFVSAVILRILETNYSGFQELVASRTDMAVEREKARDAEKQAHALAYHDPLTGLPNRRALADELTAAITGGDKARGAALLVADLDQFKSVNDVHGHLSGDALLREVAARLVELLGRDARAFRLGGDEFAILAPIGEDRDAPRSMARRIVQSISEPFEGGSVVHHIGASVGISLFPDDAQDADTLMRRADIALYRAKASGRGQYRSFEPVMDAEIKRRSALEVEMRASIKADAFRPYYQPIVRLSSGRPVGFELLARWPRAGAEVGPDQFISIAEESGLITELMLQLLRRGCAEALGWDPQLTLAINISPTQLKDIWLSHKILMELSRAGFPPGRLVVEITENALIVDPDKARHTIQSLKNQGVRIALDDFGTGYSSLQHLHMLPFDEIKIDRSFVQSLDSDGEARKIVRAIIALASTLELPVVAEGIETVAAATLLRALGCTYGQGFHFGRPMPGDRVGRLLQGAALPPAGLEPAAASGRRQAKGIRQRA